MIDPWDEEPDDTKGIRRMRNFWRGYFDWLHRPEPPKLPEGMVCDNCGSALEQLPSVFERSHRQYRAQCPDGCWPCPACGFQHGKDYFCDDFAASQARRDETTLAQRYVVFCAGCGVWHGGGEYDCHGGGSLPWPPEPDEPQPPLSPEAEKLLAEVLKGGKR